MTKVREFLLRFLRDASCAISTLARRRDLQRRTRRLPRSQHDHQGRRRCFICDFIRKKSIHVAGCQENLGWCIAIWCYFDRSCLIIHGHMYSGNSSSSDRWFLNAVILELLQVLTCLRDFAQRWNNYQIFRALTTMTQTLIPPIKIEIYKPTSAIPEAGKKVASKWNVSPNCCIYGFTDLK